MEIVNANSASLCNYEVMKHLQKLKERRKKDKRQGQLATITYETLHYLENTQCQQQTPESIAECIKALEPFNLSDNEKLIFVNTPSTTPLEIQLMIDESEDRLSEEQVQELLKIVIRFFPHLQQTSEENNVEEDLM